MRRIFLALAWLAATPFGADEGALAQDKGSLDPAPLPPIANPADPKLPAKEIFGRALTPTEV